MLDQIIKLQIVMPFHIQKCLFMQPQALTEPFFISSVFPFLLLLNTNSFTQLLIWSLSFLLSQTCSISYCFIILCLQSHLIIFNCLLSFSLWRCLICFIYQEENFFQSYATFFPHPQFLASFYIQTFLKLTCNVITFNLILDQL